MFKFVVRHLSGLRFVPGLAHLFDSLLLAWSTMRHPQIVTAIDTITAEVTAWPAVTQGLHRFGGVEFRYKGREVGHMHGNGLLDIPLTKTLREQLVADGKAQPHHIYPSSGWISFYIHSGNDTPNALALLRLAYERLTGQT